jgi:hypothetical protein
MRRQIEEWDGLATSYVIPDARLGWTINPRAAMSDRRYLSNGIGIRSDREFSAVKPRGVLRIAIFGDSFVHGDDVPLHETWAHHLEANLTARGLTPEVMNFGVGAYGNDQAYLRWKEAGRSYKPDIVVIGFQAENCVRNLNVIRKFYFFGTGVPFSKPRFVLNGDGLRLVNFPTVPYRDLPDAVEHFPDSPLRDFERLYDERDYTKRPLLSSRLVGAIDALIQRQDDFRGIFAADRETEGSELCFRIISQFAKEAGTESAVFVVHLPRSGDMNRLARGRNPVYHRLLARLKAHLPVIDPTPDLLAKSGGDIDSLFQGHYSNKGNAAVGGAVANAVFDVGKRLADASGPVHRGSTVTERALRSDALAPRTVSH